MVVHYHGNRAACGTLLPERDVRMRPTRQENSGPSPSVKRVSRPRPMLGRAKRWRLNAVDPGLTVLQFRPGPPGSLGLRSRAAGPPQPSWASVEWGMTSHTANPARVRLPVSDDAEGSRDEKPHAPPTYGAC
jgi:hypothetical protein